MSDAVAGGQIGALGSRRVLAIALPIVLSNATVPLLGLVEIGVIGQLGQAAPIAAVGLGSVILVSVYWIFGFLRMGTSGLVAQARGAGARADEGAHLLRALLIALVAGLGLILLQHPVAALAFRLAPGSVEVETLARAYLAIRIWGAPATIGLYALTGWLIATERSRAVLTVQLLMNGANVLLNLWFVLGLGWGVRGVAMATLVAEYAGVALALWLARDALRRGLRHQGLFAAAPLRRLMLVNRDILIRSVLLQACFTSFIFMAAGQGDMTLAANQILVQFLSVVAFALDGFAFAAESLVGQAVGARRPDLLRRAAWLSSAWGLAGAALLALGFALFGAQAVDILTTSPELRAVARDYLPWLVAAPLLSVASYMFDGIFIGATCTREMRNSVAVSVVVFAVLIILLPPLIGNHGLWAALMLLNLLRGVTLWRLYPRVLAAARAPLAP